MRPRHTLGAVMCLALMTHMSFAQNTGKITGKVTDASNGEPLVGVHVMIEGTTFGASSDTEGDYVIIKVPSGLYNLSATSMGYRREVSTHVQVLNDLTTTINFKLSVSTIAMKDEVVVVAEMPMVRKDMTATESRVTAEEITTLPVLNLGQLINLQAGVSRDAGGGIHIRGGRSSEISYLVNGISITDDYSRSQALTVETESIQELQIISGTFNAEYGNAMSGVVNVVTKSGTSQFRTNLELWTGDYISSHKDIFWGINRVNPFAVYNAQASVSGPIVGEEATFFATVRRASSDGYLFGFNRYSPQGRDIPADNSLVAMSASSRWSGQATVEWQPGGAFRLKMDALGSSDRGHPYNHFYRLNPYGETGNRSQGGSLIGKLTHQMFLNTFQEFTVALKYNDFVSRLYDDPLDPRYVHPDSLATPGYHFATAGTDLNRFARNTKSFIAKWDLTSQVDKHNLIKTGLEGQFDKVFYENITLVPALDASGQQRVPFVPSIEGIDAPSHDRFERKPLKLAAYIQDKIELESMIINVGVRFELFDPRGRVPVDQSDPDIYNPFRLEYIYRDLNGDGSISIDERTTANVMSVAEREAFWYRKTKVKTQISPRLGIAYPITDKGIIRFSYGIFQQIPEYSLLYLGDEFKLTSTQGLQGPFGNPDLKPQRTTIYEIGLQQQFTSDIAMDVTAFYRDIRDWISSSQPIPTVLAGVFYSERINRDIANVRGVTLSLNKSLTGYFSFGIDYTYQIAEGTNSSPDQEYFAQVNGAEPTRTLTPLDWDQLHTLNAQILVGDADIGTSLIYTLNSGQPYSPTIVAGAYTGRNILPGLAQNSRTKPLISRFDLELYKNVRFSDLTLRFFLRALNLFDAKNPINVFGETGKPDFTLQQEQVRDYDPGWFTFPTYYSEPRSVYLGTRISF